MDADVAGLHRLHLVGLIHGHRHGHVLALAHLGPSRLVGGDLHGVVAGEGGAVVVQGGAQNHRVDEVAHAQIHRDADGILLSQHVEGTDRPAHVQALVEGDLHAVGEEFGEEVGALLVAGGGGDGHTQGQIHPVGGVHAQGAHSLGQSGQSRVHSGLGGLFVGGNGLGLVQSGLERLFPLVSVLGEIQLLGLGDGLVQLVVVGDLLQVVDVILVGLEQDTLACLQLHGVDTVTNGGHEDGLTRLGADVADGLHGLVQGEPHGLGLVVVAVDQNGVLVVGALLHHTAHRQLLLAVHGPEVVPRGQGIVAAAEFGSRVVDHLGVQLHEGGADGADLPVQLADRLVEVGGLTLQIHNGGAVGLSGVGTGGVVAEVGVLLGTVGKARPDLIADVVPIGAVAVVPRHGLDVEGGGGVQLLPDGAVVLQIGVHGALIADRVAEAVDVVHDVVQKPLAVLGQLLVEGADVVGVLTAVVDVGHGVGHDLLDGGHSPCVLLGVGGLVLNVEARKSREVGVPLDEVLDLLFGLGGPGGVGEVHLADGYVHASFVGHLNGLEVVLIGDGIRVKGEVQLHVGDTRLLKGVEVVGIDLLGPEVGHEGDDVELILHAEGIHQHRGPVLRARGKILGGDHGLTHGDGVDGAVGVYLDHLVVTAGVDRLGGIQAAVRDQLQPVGLPGVHAQGGLVDDGLLHFSLLVAVQLDLAQGAGGGTAGVLDGAVTGDVNTEKLDGNGGIQLVGLGLHRRVAVCLGGYVLLGGVDRKPGLSVGGALQLKVPGEGLAVAPLHGVEDHCLQSVLPVQSDGDVHRVGLPDAAVGVGVPAQLDVTALQGLPLTVVEEGGIIEALNGNVAVGGLNVLSLGEVVGLGIPCRRRGEGRDGKHQKGQSHAEDTADHGYFLDGHRVRISFTCHSWAMAKCFKFGFIGGSGTAMNPFPSSTTCGGSPSPKGRLTVETLLLPHPIIRFSLWGIRECGLLNEPSLGGRGTAKRWMRGRGRFSSCYTDKPQFDCSLNRYKTVRLFRLHSHGYSLIRGSCARASLFHVMRSTRPSAGSRCTR